MIKTSGVWSRRWVRASRQPATVLGLAMIIACWLGVGYVLSYAHSKLENNAANQGDNLAHLFEENITNTFGGLDRVLLVLREAYERDPDRFDLRDWTARAAVIGDLTLQMSIVGPDGFTRISTPLGPDSVFAPVYLGDREHFVAQQESGTDDLFIGRPVTGRISGKWTIQISRRLSRPDGAFAGTIIASLDAEVLERFFDAVDLGPQGSVLLRRADGIILMSRGLKQFVGNNVQLPVLPSALTRGPSGHFWGRRAVDGVGRLVSYRMSEKFPVAVLVGLAEGYIFESYWRNRATYQAMAATVTVLVLLGIGLGVRHQMRLDRSEAQALLKARQLEVTLDHMAQGIVMTDANNRVPVINDRAVELLGLQSDFRHSQNGELEPGVSRLLGGSPPGPEGSVYQRVTAGGQVLEVHQSMLPDGGVVHTITDITERCRAEREIVRLAHHDELTGLANRNVFRDRVRQAIDRGACGRGFAVLCIDLDRFKTVNDTLGHSIGDELLCQVADRFKTCVREVDTVARIGGDEFVILQSDVAQVEQSTALAQRVQQLIGEPYRVAGNHLTIGVSIGIVLAPQDGVSVDQLLRNADLALYRAKAEGRNRFCFFNSDIEETALARYQIERALPIALERNEFEILYQPWVTFADGRFSGCEALLRWRDPERGLIRPSEFIEVAEDIGLIGRLGDWVLRSACRDAASWPLPVKVAVNLSAAQFITGDLVASVQAALEASGLPPERLELEITETLLLDDYEGSLAMLHRLRDQGISIALDDFGTGYSSLTYLRQFPFDRIKIDQTFVAEMTSRADCAAIVAAVAGLGRSLGIEITAEGIEIEDQLTMLRAAGCTDGQGYLICKPQSPDGIAQRLMGEGALIRMAP